MKILKQISCAACMIVAVAGSAQAGGNVSNSSTITQIGTVNNAQVVQSGYGDAKIQNGNGINIGGDLGINGSVGYSAGDVGMTGVYWVDGDQNGDVVIVDGDIVDGDTP